MDNDIDKNDSPEKKSHNTLDQWEKEFDENKMDLLCDCGSEDCEPTANLKSFIGRILSKERARAHKGGYKRREQEIIIMLDEMEKKGWSLGKAIKGLLILKDKNALTNSHQKE